MFVPLLCRNRPNHQYRASYCDLFSFVMLRKLDCKGGQLVSSLCIRIVA